MPILSRLFTAWFLVSILLAVATAQNTPDEDETVVLPDSVMQQVVSRILQWEFKPAKKTKIISISSVGIKPEWLPQITNIQFKLVPEREIRNYEDGVFFFDKVKRDGENFRMYFGSGEPECFSSGSDWRFNNSSDKLRLWPTIGIGRGCGGNSRPVIHDLKVGEASPNELSGYEFFAKGKLKNIRLGRSTRADIKELFGETCEATCEYDNDWNMWVNYFSEKADRTTTTTGSDNIETEIEFKPKPEFVGSLKFVTLTPKTAISFSKMVFPRIFAKNQSYSIGDAWGLNGFEGAVHTNSDIYTDGWGLEYKIFDEKTFNNLRNPDKSRRVLKKGELIVIKYSIPDSLNDVIFDQIKKQKVPVNSAARLKTTGEN